jgi:hypothetical protein
LYSFANEKFKPIGLILLSPDGRDEMWMLDRFTDNILKYVTIIINCYGNADHLINIIMAIPMSTF